MVHICFVFGPCFVTCYFCNHPAWDKRERESLLSSYCYVTVRILCIFLKAPWVDLQFVFVTVKRYIKVGYTWMSCDSLHAWF